MKLKNNLKINKVGSEYIIIQPESGMQDLSSVCTLSESAAYIWNEFQNRTFEEKDVFEYIISKYDVDEDRALTDVKKILNQFKNQGMLFE